MKLIKAVYVEGSSFHRSPQYLISCRELAIGEETEYLGEVYREVWATSPRPPNYTESLIEKWMEYSKRLTKKTHPWYYSIIDITII